MCLFLYDFSDICVGYLERKDMSGDREAITTHTLILSMVFPPQGISVFVEGQIHPSRGQRGGPLCSLWDGSQARKPH